VSKPVVCCPVCRSESVTTDCVRWSATSVDDPANEVEMAEHECRDCTISFWTGAPRVNRVAVLVVRSVAAAFRSIAPADGPMRRAVTEDIVGVAMDEGVAVEDIREAATSFLEDPHRDDAARVVLDEVARCVGRARKAT